MKAAFFVLILIASNALVFGQTAWQSQLDSKIRFYQTTDFGILLAGTEKSLYAIDGKNGELVWRRSTGKVDETEVTPVPNTDVVLLTRDLGSKSRLEAVDILSGARIWQSDKIKGDVMQLAVDPENDLIAIVFVKNPRGHAGDNFKRKPAVHVLQMSTGDELWKKDFDSDIEMMPARFGTDAEVDFTLDNYRAPLLLDGRLYLFYEGSTSYDARTGKAKEREKFKVNEDGLALTEADPVWDDEHIYVSGRGRIRAINRRTGNDDWKSDDLGNCAEMFQIGTTIYVRTGGRFTRIRDGETEEKGPYGVSAIDTKNGKTLWRFKGADKGLTNFAFVDAKTIVIADRDDLITLDATTGKKRSSRDHKVQKAQFVLINSEGQAVVGGREELAAFWPGNEKRPELWRVRHTPPSRGVFRVAAGIALRAASIYFRYGGLATSMMNIARTGVTSWQTLKTFRWSGLGSRFGSVDLSTLAGNATRNYFNRDFYVYGLTAKRYDNLNGIALYNGQDGFDLFPGKNGGSVVLSNRTQDIRESVIDRLDPARQAERLSDYFLRIKRLSVLQAQYMYYYTDLPQPFNKKGLVGVNIHTGEDARFITVSDPDPMFVTDFDGTFLYSADGSKLQAYNVLNR